MNYDEMDAMNAERERHEYEAQMEQEAYEAQCQADYEAEMQQQRRDEAEQQHDIIQAEIDELYDRIEMLKERQYDIRNDL